MTTQGELKNIRQKKRYMNREQLKNSTEQQHLTRDDWEKLDSYWAEQYKEDQ